MDEIISAGNHLMLLISELLDISKIETGNLQLSTSSSPPALLVEECVVMTLPQAEERDITIDNGIDSGELLAINVDPPRFKQIFLNLLSNAVKYNRQKGLIAIEYSRTENDFLRFSVEDQGAGIPAYKQDEIFEPFTRAGAKNFEVPGTGIGLAIARQIVELMGGETGVKSAEGSGSTFWFTVPVTRVNMPPLN